MIKAVGSSIKLRSKKEFIEAFISRISASTKVEEEWRAFIIKRKEKDLTTIIDEEQLKAQETHKFIDGAFRDGLIKTTGTDIDKILPPVSRFSKGGGRTEKK